jgi:hypothetical protein
MFRTNFFYMGNTAHENVELAEIETDIKRMLGQTRAKRPKPGEGVSLWISIEEIYQGGENALSRLPGAGLGAIGRAGWDGTASMGCSMDFHGFLHVTGLDTVAA